MSDFSKKKDLQKKKQLVVHRMIDEKFPFSLKSIENRKEIWSVWRDLDHQLPIFRVANFCLYHAQNLALILEKGVPNFWIPRIFTHFMKKLITLFCRYEIHQVNQSLWYKWTFSLYNCQHWKKFCVKILIWKAVLNSILVNRKHTKNILLIGD